MTAKKYTSYAEIDKDLEILKLEKEISYQKLVLELKETKEQFTPRGIVKQFLGSYQSILSESFTSIITMAIPHLIGWLLKRKKTD